MTDFKHYTILANLFRYPSERLIDDALEAIVVLSLDYPEQAEIIKDFIENFSGLTLHQRQEYYIKTFDIQAVCFLDIGYVLFGEDYKRGDFLVQMKQEQREANNDCGVELSDHLPNVLTLFPKASKEFSEELIATICIPALDDMIDKFNMQNAYLELLKMLQNVMKHDTLGTDYNPFIIKREDDTGFLSNYKGCGVDQSLFERKNTTTKQF
jgi:nitrate reductase assembly molybdenum cofactor insertion protein NarJ